MFRFELQTRTEAKNDLDASTDEPTAHCDRVGRLDKVHVVSDAETLDDRALDPGEDGDQLGLRLRFVEAVDEQVDVGRRPALHDRPSTRKD